MGDYTNIITMLDEIRLRVDAIKDQLGRIQVQEGGEHESGQISPKVFAPSSTDLEVMGGKNTNQFADCCAVGDENDFCCSGTLIAANIVVTADHCHGITRVFFGTDVSAQGTIIRVSKQFAHPEVDLRVLVLDQEAPPVPRRVARGAEIGNPSKATVVGFGTIDKDGTVGYGTKRLAEVPIVSLDGAEPGAHKKYGCVPGWELVAGHRGLAIDTCCGDSGGPIYIQMADGQHALLGATSRGVRDTFTKCGDGGIYVRVDRCLDWIQSVTGVQI